MSFASKVGKVLEGFAQALPTGIQVGTQISQIRRSEELQRQQAARQQEQDIRQRGLDAERRETQRQAEIRAIASRGDYAEALRQAEGMPELQAEIRAAQQRGITQTAASLPAAPTGALPSTAAGIESRIGTLAGQEQQYGQVAAQLGTMGAPAGQMEAITRGAEELRFEREQLEKLLNPFSSYATETSLPARELRRQELVELLRSAGYNTSEINARVKKLDEAADAVQIDRILSLLTIDPTADLTGVYVPDRIRTAVEARQGREELGRRAEDLAKVTALSVQGALNGKEAGVLFDSLAGQYGLDPESQAYQTSKQSAVNTAQQISAKTQDDVYRYILRLQQERQQWLVQTGGAGVDPLRIYASLNGVELSPNPTISELTSLANTVILKQQAGPPTRDLTSDLKATPENIKEEFNLKMNQAAQILSGNNERQKELVRAALRSEILNDPNATPEEKERARQVLGEGSSNIPFLAPTMQPQQRMQTPPRVRLPQVSTTPNSTRSNQPPNTLPTSGTGQFRTPAISTQ